MNKMLLVAAIALVAIAGCQRQPVVRPGELSDADKDRLMAESLGAYARKEGLSRKQAAQQLRQEADLAAASGQGCGCLVGSHAPGCPAPQTPATAATPGDRYPVNAASYVDAPLPGAPIRR